MKCPNDWWELNLLVIQKPGVLLTDASSERCDTIAFITLLVHAQGAHTIGCQLTVVTIAEAVSACHLVTAHVLVLVDLTATRQASHVVSSRAVADAVSTVAWAFCRWIRIKKLVSKCKQVSKGGHTGGSRARYLCIASFGHSGRKREQRNDWMRENRCQLALKVLNFWKFTWKCSEWIWQSGMHDRQTLFYF